MDQDTTRNKGAHEKIIEKFKNHEFDILLGTQMIAKGHDFENVTLVGVLAADSSLNIGDYKANERTYQLLTQVAGRAGRGSKKGKAIIQTYLPDEFSIKAVKEQNYKNFYDTEINMREKLNYPPFCDIIVIGFNSQNAEELKETCKNVYNYLKSNLNLEDFNVFKPMPAPIDKIQNRLRYRIIIKGNKKKECSDLKV